MNFLSEVALGVIIGWIVLVILFFIFLLRKYTFSKNWSKDNPNPYAKETLSMPRGVFRAVLTLSILFVVIILEVHSLSYDAKTMAEFGKEFIPEKRFEQMMVAFQMMLAFYFGSKVMHHVTSAERQTAEKKADADMAAQKMAAARQGNFEDQGAVG